MASVASLSPRRETAADVPPEASVGTVGPRKEPAVPAANDNWVEDLEKAENRLQDNASVVRNEIRAFFHYCREKLDARERKLMAQLDDNCRRVSGRLDAHRAKLLASEPAAATQPSKRELLSISDADRGMLSGALDGIPRGGEEGPGDEDGGAENGSANSDDKSEDGGAGEGEFPGDVRKCPHRRKHLLRKIKNSPEINLSLADSDARKRFARAVGDLGLVYAGKADPSRTVACCRPALVRARCTGKVKAVDKHGDECRQGRDDVSASLEAPSGDATECAVADCRNGTYNVTFVPTELGKHRLHVKVSGVPLTHGPLEVHARFVRVHVKSAFLGGSCIFALEIPSDYELDRRSEDGSSECAATLTPQMLEIGVRDPEGKETRCTVIGCTDERLGVARYNARFFPLRPGDHEISVSLPGGPALLQQVVPVQEREQIGSRGSEAGQMFSPTDISISQKGEIFVADTVENARVQRFATDGEYLSSFPVDRQEPSIIAADHRQVAVLFQGSMEMFIYTHDGGKTRSFKVDALAQPTDMAFTSAGHVAVIDRKLCTLLLFDKTGKVELRVGKEGTKPGELGEPYFVCVTDDDQIFISEHGNRRVQHVDEKGAYVKDLRSKEKMAEPGALASTAGGHLLVFDEKERRVQIVNLDENRFSGSLFVDLLEPRTARMAATPDGFLVVLDMLNNCLWRYRIPFEY